MKDLWTFHGNESSQSKEQGQLMKNVESLLKDFLSKMTWTVQTFLEIMSRTVLQDT